MDKIRTFVSIDLPKDIQKEVKKIQDILPEFEGKKTEPKNLHLTLKFLREIDKEKIENVNEALRKIKFKSFETEIGYLGFFDNKKSSVVWIHLPNCEALQKEVDKILSDIFEQEKRFMSHVTIARVKGLKDKNRFIEELEKIKTNSLKFRVNRFRLKKSTLTPDGPVYEILEEYALR